ncbi:hypothetical protein D3C80_1028180 [compost metagenome]
MPVHFDPGLATVAPNTQGILGRRTARRDAAIRCQVLLPELGATVLKPRRHHRIDHRRACPQPLGQRDARRRGRDNCKVGGDVGQVIKCLLGVTVMQGLDSVVDLAQQLPYGHREHDQPQARCKERRQVEQRPPFCGQPFVMGTLKLAIKPSHRHRDHRCVLLDLADARLRQAVEQR